MSRRTLSVFAAAVGLGLGGLVTAGSVPAAVAGTTGRVVAAAPNTPRLSGAVVVDAIGDGGPDRAHWNAGLAAAIRGHRPAVLLWSGDVRNRGTQAEWKLYDSFYGALKRITLPTPGNHDFGSRATGYNVEFGTGAPLADTKTYCNSVALANGWGLFSINSYTRASCLPKLKAFLARPGNRKIVLTHVPRWSGGPHGSSAGQASIWNAMKGHAFALVSGHDHDMQVIERDGLVQVVSGCAGAAYYPVRPISGEVYHSNSAADCTFSRFLLGSNSVVVSAVRANGAVAFSRTYTVR